MSSRSVSLRVVLAPLILLELAALYMVMRNNSWAFDDNFFLVLAGQEGFTWHWLTSVQFEHWDIGEHAVLSLQHRLFFLDYRWALLLMLGLLGGMMFLLQRSLAMVVKNRWVVLAFVAWFGLNILWTPGLQWWSVGVQGMPSTFFDLLCLYGFLRYHAGGGNRWIAVSASALAVALLFFEKPAFMLLYLLLLRILLMSEEVRPGRILAVLWRERGVWSAYAAVIALWAIGYLHSHAYSPRGGVSLAQYLDYFRILWFQTLVPAFAGITLPPSNLDGVQILFVVASQAALLGCVVLSVRRRPSAWRAWAFLTIILVVSGVLVARSRVAVFGVDIANDPRYQIDFSWIVPLALCAAFTRSDLLKPALERSTRLSLPSLKVVVLATVLLLAYAVAAIASAAHRESSWAGPQARKWEERMRSGIAELKRSGSHLIVAENATPFEIMAEFVAPYNRLSRVLPMYVGAIQVDGPLDAPLVRIANDGTVHQATIVSIDGKGTFLDLVRSHRIDVGSGGRTVREGQDLCVIADGVPVSVERRLGRLPGGTSTPYYVRLAYRVWQPVGLPVLVDTGTGYPPAPDHAIELSPKASASISWLGVGVPHRVELDIPPLTTVCISRFDVVTLGNAR